MSEQAPHHANVPAPPEPRDHSQMGASPVRPERPRIVAWRPGHDRPSRPIIVALREAGVDCWIGSRREPVNNFEVSCLVDDVDRVRAIIADVDPDAAMLARGR